MASSSSRRLPTFDQVVEVLACSRSGSCSFPLRTRNPHRKGSLRHAAWNFRVTVRELQKVLRDKVDETLLVDAQLRVEHNAQPPDWDQDKGLPVPLSSTSSFDRVNQLRVLARVQMAEASKRRGRPSKDFSQDLQSWLCHASTLRSHAGLALEQRANLAERKFGIELKAHHVRKIYKANLIKRQTVFPKITSEPKPTAVQLEETRDLEMRVDQATRIQGRELIFVDEAIFQLKRLSYFEWAPKGAPLRYKNGLFQAKPVAVLGGISATFGKIKFDLREFSFKGEHVREYLEGLDQLMQLNGVQHYAVFWDNASIHKSAEVKAFQEASEGRCVFVRNIPYRPDLNPIELFWGRCKRAYRSQVQRLVTSEQGFKNADVVGQVLEQIPDEYARKLSIAGLNLLVRIPTVGHDGRHARFGDEPVEAPAENFSEQLMALNKSFRRVKLGDKRPGPDGLAHRWEASSSSEEEKWS